MTAWVEFLRPSGSTACGGEGITRGHFCGCEGVSWGHFCGGVRVSLGLRGTSSAVGRCVASPLSGPLFNSPVELVFPLDSRKGQGDPSPASY